MFLGEINQFAKDFGETKAKFVFVYILEAHATDEWPIACINDVLPQHKSLQDRANAARIFQESYPLQENIELLLDNVHNDFNATYASWPFRYWIIHQGRVEVKSMPENDAVSLKQLYSYLERL